MKYLVQAGFPIRAGRLVAREGPAHTRNSASTVYFLFCFQSKQFIPLVTGLYPHPPSTPPQNRTENILVPKNKDKDIQTAQFSHHGPKRARSSSGCSLDFFNYFYLQPVPQSTPRPEPSLEPSRESPGVNCQKRQGPGSQQIPGRPASLSCKGQSSYCPVLFLSRCCHCSGLHPLARRLVCKNLIFKYSSFYCVRN